MVSAALRRGRLGAIALLALSCAVASTQRAQRAAPSRPDPIPLNAAPLGSRKVGGLQYVNVADVATRLGLSLTWIRRGHSLTLTSRSARVEIENDSRDITVNGLRVFLGDKVVDVRGALFVSKIDFERCLAPLLRPGHGGVPLAPPKTIVLDPGHGGRDTGTSLNEKIYALDVAQRAKKRLEAAGFRVVLTREKDVFVELAHRPAVANLHKADVFVSIHFNALPKDTKTSGVEMFTFAPQFQRSAEAWSPLQRDDTEDFASPNNRFDHWNVVLAQSIHRRFVTDLKTFDRGKKLAHWGVLRPLNCPGVLVECGFLTSDAEAKKIATPAYREQIAEAIAGGISDYAATVARIERPGSKA
jgi:N-acetylmuramoyl-L-alanine amidase